MLHNWRHGFDVVSPAATPIGILLVEDNPGDAGLIAAMLAECRDPVFTVQRVDRLADALRLLPGANIDVVLLDLSLPDSHGLDTLATMRSGAPNAPIVVLTGLMDDSVGVAAVKMGAQDFLVKGQIDGGLVARAVRYAIERKSAEQQLRHQQERITVLYEIHKAISATLDLGSILNLLVDKSSILVPGAAVTVELWNEEIGCLEPVICRNIDADAWKSGLPGGGNRPSRMVVEERRPFAISDLRAIPGLNCFLRGDGSASYLGVPLIVKDDLVGVLGVYAFDGHVFDAGEMDFFAALSGQAAVAIRNSQLYERTRQQASELKRANGVKDEFISVISHELKTPVNVIMGYAKLVGEQVLGRLNGEQETALKAVSASARALADMINDILQVVCLDGGTLQPALADVDVVRLLDALRSSCKVPPGKKLEVEWNYSSDLPVMRTDPDKLTQIVLHLLNNAIKFTEQGRVSVEAGYLKSEDRLQLRVADSGVGIGRQMLPRVFEKFQQADSSSTRAHEGIGLGLYIVKKLTDLLAGTIEVDSEIGRGSVFTLSLPRRRGQRLRHLSKGEGFFPDH